MTEIRNPFEMAEKECSSFRVDFTIIQKKINRGDLSKRCTAIDLTIISDDIMNKCEREVLEHHMGATNHKAIITKIQEKNKL